MQRHVCAIICGLRGGCARQNSRALSFSNTSALPWTQGSTTPGPEGEARRIERPPKRGANRNHRHIFKKNSKGSDQNERTATYTVQAAARELSDGHVFVQE